MLCRRTAKDRQYQQPPALRAGTCAFYRCLLQRRAHAPLRAGRRPRARKTQKGIVAHGTGVESDRVVGSRKLSVFSPRRTLLEALARLAGSPQFVLAIPSPNP